MNKQEKWLEYAVQITTQIADMFDEESENHIDAKELEDPKNNTAFFHALLNVAPTIIYNKLTDKNRTFIDINHIANKLCFQFGNKEEESSH